MKLKLKKGLKLNISGSLPATPDVADLSREVKTVAVTPDDFPGFTPKPAVKEGDAVTPGDALLFDKRHPEVKLVSPVAGTVRGVVRGERRKILRVEIDCAETPQPAATVIYNGTTAADAHSFLAQNGLLALMRQRPYDIVPVPGSRVRDIFVSAVDNAPLAPSVSTLGELFEADDFKAGAALLRQASEGKVYFAHDAQWPFGKIEGTEDVEVEGGYPAGNAGMIAANVAPVNKGETIWALDAQALGRIGRIVRTGRPQWLAAVALTGPEVERPALLLVPVGSVVAPLLAGRLKASEHHVRIVSGNLLTGCAIEADGYLHFPYRQLTVIADGDDCDEFMGWASFSPSKMSESRTFPGHFLSRAFSPDARLLGGRRAMIMSGEYDRYMPADILPEYLLKAIISRDIESMEHLGIYEVAPEDFAAAEYADTSKMPLQQIVREGLDFLRKELE